MTSTPDLVIRGGNIADGRGGDLYEAGVAISGGRITEVGKVTAKGKEEIDARGKLVAPGFVDVHTHYDGQVTWSQDITPSSQNGVTTAMAALAGDAVRSGALGFSTSRTLNHRTSTGDYTPTLKAGEDELTAIAAAMHGQGRSVFQFVLDLSTLNEDLPMMLRVAENTRIPVSFS